MPIRNRWRAVVVALLLTSTVASAQETAFTVPVPVRESVRVAKCGRSRADVTVRLHVLADETWAANLPGGELVRGRYETRGRRGTKLLLTADQGALAALASRLEAEATVLCDTPRTLTGAAVRRFLVKLNRARTKARVKLKTSAILDDGKRAALSWRGSGLTEPLDPPPTTTSTTVTTTTSTSVPTTTSTTLPCTAIDLGSTLPLTVSSTTSGAGNDASPADTCFAFGVPPMNGEDVLYTWTAPVGGTFVFDTLASQLDTVLYAVAGCGGGELVCNDDFGLSPGTGGSSIGVQMTAGQQLVVVVDSYASSGSFTLEVTGPVAGGNCCAQRDAGGCELPAVEACLCDVDGPCCTQAWDATCVAEAESFCALQCQ